MVGVIVEDMQRAAEFYRRLGVAVPDGAEEQEHVEVAMSGSTFFLSTKRGTRAGIRRRGRPPRAAIGSSSSSISRPERHWTRSTKS